MDRLKRTALTLLLIDRLRHNGSWCGETHIQKSAFILECMNIEAFKHGFTIYKYGPYSFAFHDFLGRMLADSVLAMEIQPPYGPHLYPVEEKLAQFLKLFPKTKAAVDSKIDFVTQWMGKKSVSEMEQIATALYIWKNSIHSGDAIQIAKELVSIKPHVSMPEAESAIDEVKSKMAEMAWNPF